MGFETLGLVKPLLRVLERQGLSEPTPIQKKAIPLILAGKDLVGLAQTGTGKTAAFTLPVLNILYELKRTGKYRPIRLVVLSPTRELAVQVDNVIKTFGSAVNLKSVPVFGGAPFYKQAQALRKGSDIVVCTPGRLEDHISQGTIDLSQVSHFVLDEADQMLDIGFFPVIKRILSLLPITKQTLLFSATMPQEIKTLSFDYLNNPAEVAVASLAKPADNINQLVLCLKGSEKLKLLENLIRSRQSERILVFSRTKHGADKIVKSLSNVGLTLTAIHGNKSQMQRQMALKNFKIGKCFVLVATDIAARGIDVQSVELVVNYDLPDVPETYVHRIGRTARAGASGHAISFCVANERKNLKAIERLIKMRITTIAVGSEKIDWRQIMSDPYLIRTSRNEKGTGNKKKFRFKKNINSDKKQKVNRHRAIRTKRGSVKNLAGEESLQKK